MLMEYVGLYVFNYRVLGECACSSWSSHFTMYFYDAFRLAPASSPSSALTLGAKPTTSSGSWHLWFLLLSLQALVQVLGDSGSFSCLSASASVRGVRVLVRGNL